MKTLALRVARTVRANAQSIMEIAESLSDPSDFVSLALGGDFAEPVTEEELYENFPGACAGLLARAMLHDLARSEASIRVSVVGEGFAWVALYHVTEHAPERPQTIAWFGPHELSVRQWTRLPAWHVAAAQRFAAVACLFPSLRGAPGGSVEHFAEWARSQPTSVAAAAACALELGAGLRHVDGGHVEQLFRDLGGLSWVALEAADREALDGALRARRQEVPPLAAAA